MANLKQTHSSMSPRNHGGSTNIMSYLLGDSSIAKAIHEKTRTDRLIEAVKNKEITLKTQKEVRIITEKRRYVQESWEKRVKGTIISHSKYKVKYELAAIKIQKIVRGFLVRIKIDPMLLVQRELTSETIIVELRKQTDFCMLTLGSNTIPVRYK